MLKTKLLLVYLIIMTGVLYAQSGKITGTITDSKTGSPVSEVNILLKELNYSVTSNSTGNYYFGKVPAGNYTIIYTHLAYRSREKSVSLEGNESLTLNLELDPAAVKLGEVMVTGFKTDRLLKEVPLPVEIVDSRKIERGSFVTPSEAAAQEPGVSIIRDGAWASQVNIRGLGKQNIVTLVDGNRIETATNVAAGLSLVDLNDIESIEIIKGGVSSLYGSGATGGVIDIKTKAPSYSEDLKIHGAFSGGFRTVNNERSTNLKINTEMNNLFFGANGSYRDAHNTETPEGRLENSQYTDYNLSLNGGLKIAEGHELRIDYQKFKAEDVGIPGGDPFPATASARYPVEVREMYSARYNLRLNSGPLTKAYIKYFHQLIKREVELRPNANIVVNPKADHNTDGIQLNTEWIPDNNNYIAAGIDAWQRNYEGVRTKTNVPQNTTTFDKPVPKSWYRSLGFYIKDEMKLDDRLSMDIGGRIDFINIENEEAKNPWYIIKNGTRIDPPANPDASFEAKNDNDFSWSTNVGMLYGITPWMDATLNVARSFRSPNLEERFQYIDLGGVIYLGNPELDPEKSYSFDAGLRYWGEKVSVKGNVYLNLFDDLVADVLEKDGLYRKQNIGEARLYGFELSGEAVLSGLHSAYCSAAYTRGEDTGNEKDLAEIPSLNGTVGVKGEFEGIFGYNIGAELYAEQDKVAEGEAETPSYAVFNLNLYSPEISLAGTGVRLYAGIDNIFDKAYRNHLSTYRGITRLEPGRNIFFKLKLTF